MELAPNPCYPPGAQHPAIDKHPAYVPFRTSHFAF